jgi:hypothetical protein
VLSEEDAGYVAAKFEGKNKQMEAGWSPPLFLYYCAASFRFASSEVVSSLNR